MATISISIIKSPMEVVAGIPTTVTLTSNVPSTIFYTLDGTTPTTSSLVAVGPIKLPTNQPSVELQAIATDGLTFSPVISELFGPTLVGARMPHDTVNLNQDCPGKATYPFGSPVASFNNPVIYGNTGEVIVDKVGETDHTPDGYDGTATGTPANYLSNPTTQFDFIFSETDSIGQMGRGIGTLPANVIWIKPRNNNNIQEQTNYGSKFFNPKALVVFQDSREEPYDPSLTKINRAYFDLEDQLKLEMELCLRLILSHLSDLLLKHITILQIIL
jgi:hypothetical protein